MTAEQLLTCVKLAHTLIWAVMAGAIVAVPIAAICGRYLTAAWLSLLVWIEWRRPRA